QDLINGVGRRRLVAVSPQDTVQSAIDLIEKYDIEQLPVMENNALKGSVSQHGLFKKLLKNIEIKNETIDQHIEVAMPVVAPGTPLDRLSSYINAENGSVLVKDEANGDYQIITKYDILNALSK